MKAWKIVAAAALGGFLVVSATAAPLTGIGQSEQMSVADQAKAKAKAKRAAPGKCGVMMYYNRKTRTCASKG